MRPVAFPNREDRWLVEIGSLAPVEELSGVQARLDNLAFPCPVDGTESPDTTAAIRAYQRWRGVGDGEGTLDDGTRNDLRGYHDG
jgi:peptidoglycan hydrolase-like protein with peptidoglycan-binding domain